MKILHCIFLMLIWHCSFAQSGFCGGSKGDPIFHQDFGSGTGTGPELPPGTTSYSFVHGDPIPGQYTVSDQISTRNSSWHPYLPDDSASGGRALVVDAGERAGLFYETTISGLCESTSYEFSAYVMNIYDAANPACSNGGIPVNVRFEIYDSTGTQLLGRMSTGNIHSSYSPQWGHYGLTFNSEEGGDEIILRMYNNGAGGCGNDLAIDDIIFRSCGDLTTIASEEEIRNELLFCESEVPVEVNLYATPDYSVYEGHFFQWQESSDRETWQDLPGETSDHFSTSISSGEKYYRVKVAESELNLADNLCSSATEPFYVGVTKRPGPPRSLGDLMVCGYEEITPLKVDVPGDETVNWYDKDGNILAEGTYSYLPAGEGTFYAEAVDKNAVCEPSGRTAISLTFDNLPEVEDEILNLCEGAGLNLYGTGEDVDYLWSTGENSREIFISSPGSYWVDLISEGGCRVRKNFEIKPVEIAVIKEVISEGTRVIVFAGNDGHFEYSLDGVNFQFSNVFEMVPGGIYTAYMRDSFTCHTTREEFPHIIIPEHISPNGDGNNDNFEVPGLGFFPSSEISIFDRYGKLLKTGQGQSFSWDGRFQSKDMPPNNYWFAIRIEGFKMIKGSFSLLR